MTRSEALKNLLKSILGSISLSVADGKICKSNGGNNYYSSCYYTAKSYQKFKELFKEVFIEPAPQYSDLTSFDKERAISNAKEYLSHRGITVPYIYSNTEQNDLLFTVLTEYYLKAIVIDEEGDSKEIARDRDITSILIKTNKEVKEHFNVICAKYGSKKYITKDLAKDNIIIIDSDYSGSPEKCNYEHDFYYSKFDVYKFLMSFSLIISIPCKQKNDPPEPSSLYDKFIYGSFTEETINYEQFTCKLSPDFSKSKEYIKWKTYIDGNGVISKSNNSSLSYVAQNYCNSLISRAKTQVEDKMIEELSIVYETKQLLLESIIQGIIKKPNARKYNLSDASFFIDQAKLKEFLLEKCFDIFGDFEFPYLIIEETYCDNISKGLYITIQNTIIELTELLINDGENIAKMFKLVLSKESFNNHKRVIKHQIQSKKNFDFYIQIESRLSSCFDNCKSKPQCISDYFSCIRENTFCNFWDSLHKYGEYLEKQD